MFALLVALYVVGLDQLTKEWIRGSVRLYETLPVWDGFFQVTYVKNTGAAWGMFSGQNWALIALAAGMLAALWIFRRKILPRTLMGSLVAGLLTGGILGNLLDRLRLDFVTDYLDFYAGTWHFPAFNVADAAIFCGVCCFVWCTFLEERAEKRAAARRNVKRGNGGAADGAA